MSFTVNHIKATNLELTDEERTFIENQLMALAPHIGDEEAVTCDVEIERSAHHISGNVYRAEVNCMIRGSMFRAEETEDTLQKAVDAARDEIVRVVREEREKNRSLFRKGSRLVKRIMRGTAE